MTRLQLRTLALDYLDDANGSYFTSSIMNLRLYLALRELQKHLISANKQYYSKCVTSSTVVNQEAYALPSDFYQVIRFEYLSAGTGVNSVWEPIEWTTPNQKDPYSDLSGYPKVYWFDKDNVLLKPIPNSVLTLRLTYSYLVADMADDAAEPDAPEQFHEYIAILAARDGFLKDGRSLAPIESKMSEYKMLLKEIANQRNADKPRMIVSTGAGYGGF